MYHVFLANHLLLSPNKILHDRQSQKLHLTSPKLAARLAVFLDLPTVHVFDRLQYAKRRGRPGPFNHVNDVSTEGNGGGVPNWKNTFLARVLRFEPGAVCFSLCDCSKLQCLGQKIQDKACSNKNTTFCTLFKYTFNTWCVWFHPPLARHVVSCYLDMSSQLLSTFANFIFFWVPHHLLPALGTPTHTHLHLFYQRRLETVDLCSLGC